MGYREVVTGPPPDPELGQIRHGGSLPPCSTSSHTPPVPARLGGASLSLAGLPLSAPLGLSLESPPQRCFPKHLHSPLFFHCTLLGSSIAQPMYI